MKFSIIVIIKTLKWWDKVGAKYRCELWSLRSDAKNFHKHFPFSLIKHLLMTGNARVAQSSFLRHLFQRLKISSKSSIYFVWNLRKYPWNDSKCFIPKTLSALQRRKVLFSFVSFILLAKDRQCLLSATKSSSDANQNRHCFINLLNPLHLYVLDS